jgi:glycosyltransferase involved in cell wall biosynthesis
MMSAASAVGSLQSGASPQKRTVSVVIPAYNAAEFLAEALDSVLAQTYQPLEVIVVDDGSEDETPEVVAAYADKVTYTRKPRGGPASGRNVGIRAASGEWIAFLDADDIWMPELLEKLVKTAAKTRADLIFCDALTLRNGRAQGATFFERCGHKKALDIDTSNGVLRNPFELLLASGNYISTCGVLVRRDLLLEIGLFDEGILCGEDLDLWLRVAHRYQFAVVNEALVLRRIHATNVSLDPWVRVTGDMHVCEKLERYAPTAARDAKWRVLLAERRARVLRERGALQLAEGEILSARESWASSLRSSFSLTVAAYWLASFLPQTWVEALCNWKRRIRSLPARPAY